VKEPKVKSKFKYCPSIFQVLTESRNQSMKQLISMEEEDDFDDPMSPTPVKGTYNLKKLSMLCRRQCVSFLVLVA